MNNQRQNILEIIQSSNMQMCVRGRLYQKTSYSDDNRPYVFSAAYRAMAAGNYSVKGQPVAETYTKPSCLGAT